MEGSYVHTTEKTLEVLTETDVTSNIIVSDYFKKELCKKIPACQSILKVDNINPESDVQCHLRILLSIPLEGNDGYQNTIDNVKALESMGKLIAALIVANSSITPTIQSIAKDCKAWFPEHKTGDNESA